MTAIPSTLDILRRLISFETVSLHSNLALLDYVESLLVSAGARAERFAHEDGSRANLWVTVGPEIGGGIVLSGHSDVVPVTGQNWSHDPFTLREENGRYYGRGTADMKGFVAAAIRAILTAATRQLDRPLHLALSYDEEIGCMGVRSLIAAIAARPLRPALCIIGEPTGMKIASGHKGKTAYRACCFGQEGHSALAPNAMNAIHLGAAFIAGLQAEQERLARTGHRDPCYDIPYSTIHAGIIRSGTALNIVPNLCEIDFEIRNLAEDDPAEILKALVLEARAITAPHHDRFPQARIEIAEISGYPGLKTEESDPVIALLRRITGEIDTPIKVAFGTEGGLFREATGMSTAICGPGFMEQGHKPDEFVSAEQLALCDQSLARLVDEITTAPQ